MVFIFDVDDTISETDEYSEKYILDYFAKHNLPYKKVAENVRYAEQKFDWDSETFLHWYKTYGDEMMLHFPCKNNATEVINFLHEKGHKIVIATARSTNWHTKPKEITLEWLKINNIPFDKFYYARNDKEQICIEEKVDVFVDDDITITAKVAEQFANQPNKYVFLPTTNYNKDLKENENVIRINSLNDIIKILNLQ